MRLFICSLFFALAIFFNLIELGSQSEFPHSLFPPVKERRVAHRERPSMHDNGLRFEVVRGVIKPKTRIRKITKLYTPDGYVFGVDVYDHFYHVFENDTPVEIMEATATTPAKIRPLNRDGLPPVQYRSVIRPPTGFPSFPSTSQDHLERLRRTH
ncbi:uncharacterized protein LOC117173801 [Belonocnema kinseyi]|uniref:uncharacterized protein LOC117173801 n=1 Tax=Belonocnema kinseyi TaxID=2817044 RepID=UPI00143CC373|nr:uncharacterized protein LOC117173801 [Belonocnema kinseyi]